ncbi:MAG: hypothetical protein JNK64_09295 [Myxococcales bacterium]|nr:hypothetical protein [Myxococcales bacterium]
MSVVMKRRPWVRRMIASALVVGALGGAVVGAQAIERAVNRDPYGELVIAMYQRAGEGFSAALEARFASEARDPAFAADRERFLRDRVLPAVQTNLPEVTLGKVDCRQTMCQWTFDVPDLYSDWVVMSAPWRHVGTTSLRHDGDARVAALLGIVAVPDQARADAAIVDWFERATPAAMLHHFTSQGRTDAHFVHMVTEWAAAHPRR